jgi:hypothetical protein
MMDQFLALSIELTGYNKFILEGTGLADAYLAAAVKIVGKPIVEELLAKYAAGIASARTREEELRREILGDEKLGPVARNIMKMWFIGIWEPLPSQWTECYGPIENNSGFMVSAAAYREGLLWLTIGANPPGAKAIGYGAWALPPSVTSVDAP